MKILITGHEGFIGQNALKRFSKNHKVICYEYNSNFFPEVKSLDVVMHFGAISSTTETDVEKVLTQNYDFTSRLIRDCVYHEVKLQYSSSASVYGMTKSFKETDEVNPLTPYAWSKYLIERFARQFEACSIIQGFRYFNVYGPNEDHKGNQASPYHKFEQQAKNFGKISVFENSHNYLRDFVHVDEVLDAHEKFLSVNESGVWNVGTGKPKSFMQVAKEISEKYNASIVEIPMPDILKNSYQSYTCADLTKFRTSLKGTYTISENDLND